MEKVIQPEPGTEIGDRDDGAVLVMDAPRDGWPMAHIKTSDGTEYAPQALAALIARGFWTLRTFVNLAPDEFYQITPEATVAGEGG
jgi:hypothetical protein